MEAPSTLLSDIAFHYGAESKRYFNTTDDYDHIAVIYGILDGESPVPPESRILAHYNQWRAYQLHAAIADRGRPGTVEEIGLVDCDGIRGESLEEIVGKLLGGTGPTVEMVEACIRDLYVAIGEEDGYDTMGVAEGLEVDSKLALRKATIMNMGDNALTPKEQFKYHILGLAHDLAMIGEQISADRVMLLAPQFIMLCGPRRDDIDGFAEEMTHDGPRSLAEMSVVSALNEYGGIQDASRRQNYIRQMINRDGDFRSDNRERWGDYILPETNY